MKICFATNNLHKLEEAKSLLNFELVTLDELGCTEEVPETSETIEGNSLQKAKYIWDTYKVPCFADDTGLEIESLNNEPGVRSARYAGNHKNSLDNIELVLSKLKNIKQKNAQFKTVITLILSESEQYQFEGIVKGEIIDELKGNNGFGYDSIFVPNGFDKTFAELSFEIKNTISHRAKALNKLVDFCKTKKLLK